MPEYNDSQLEFIQSGISDEFIFDEVSGDFIDIEPAEEDVLDDFGISGEDATGRNFAQKTFDRVEAQIVDHYEMLADDEDKRVFREYLLTNLMLYFDKFESELAGTVEEPTNQAYDMAAAGDTGMEEPTPDEVALGL